LKSNEGAKTEDHYTQEQTPTDNCHHREPYDPAARISKILGPIKRTSQVSFKDISNPDYVALPDWFVKTELLAQFIHLFCPFSKLNKNGKVPRHDDLRQEEYCCQKEEEYKDALKYAR
jgi:hypothetical protein